MKAVGLFAGIGGIELGLTAAGHETLLLCEIDPGACAVLARRFPAVPLVRDIREIGSLPRETELVAAGFPCQDISQAGMTAGIDGQRSGLIHEVFRLLRKRPAPWVLLENVPFMLQLNRGKAMEVIAREFETLGYSWAYRVVDSRAFGLPQRRKRVYFLAARSGDPRAILFGDVASDPSERTHAGKACGFYWTEGLRGLGWAVDAVPTLKGGSTVGIPSPPAIWLPGGDIVTPDIRDAERMQGFAPDWTLPAEEVVRPTFRWKLVGNAVSVPVAAWIGKRLSRPKQAAEGRESALVSGTPWPHAASYTPAGGRRTWLVGQYPTHPRAVSLMEFLRYPPKALSLRATRGFLSRLEQSGLDYPPEFLTALKAHAARLDQPNQPRLALDHVYS